MSARRDKRNGHWFYRKQVRFPDGHRERIFGVPTIDGLPDTKAGAEEAEHRAIQRVLSTGEAQPTPPAPKKEVPTVREFSQTFMEISSVINKHSTLRSKRKMIDVHIVPRLGALRLDEVDYATVEDFKMALARSPRGNATRRKDLRPLVPKTVNNILLVLHRMLLIAKKRGLISSVPEFEWLKAPLPPVKFLSLEESDQLVNAADPEWRAMIDLALRAGLRRGELLALRWEDVDFDNKNLSVFQNYVDGVIGTPKSGKPRVIPLSDESVALLKSHRHLKGPLVFCNADGSILSTSRAHHGIAHAAKRARVKAGWHVLRHTFATQLSSDGTPLPEIKNMLGHSTIAMTMRYAHPVAQVARDAVNRMDRRRNVAASRQRPLKIFATD